jgi:phosphoribosyl-ATP pyrophosphohydrolase
MKNKKITLETLFEELEKKSKTKDKNSYTSFLLEEGIEKINRKIGEEAIEVIIASFSFNKIKSQKKRQDLIGEICDLFYHLLVLMIKENINFQEIINELTKRNNAKSKRRNKSD